VTARHRAARRVAAPEHPDAVAAAPPPPRPDGPGRTGGTGAAGDRVGPAEGTRGAGDRPGHGAGAAAYRPGPAAVSADGRGGPAPRQRSGPPSPTPRPRSGGNRGAFRVLIVCSGNVCRSPLAERLLRIRLQEQLGPVAARFTVTSAGTTALVGEPMDPDAAAVARSLGADPDGFRARQVDAEQVAAADLVLTAAREHRGAVLRLHPPAHRTAFTLREFARLTAAVPADALPDLDPVLRARALVAAASGRRGLHRPVLPGDDDVPDPYRAGEDVHRAVGQLVTEALDGPVAVLAGAAPAGLPEQPARAAPARRRPVRRGLTVAAGLAVLLAAAGAWLTVRGLAAQREVTAARGDLAVVRSTLLAGDVPGARRALAAAQDRTGRAASLTGDPVWRAAAALPWVGDTPDAVRTAAATVDDLTSTALPVLVDAGAALAPAKLRPSGDRVDVAAFVTARPALESALVELERARGRIDRFDSAWLPGPVSGALDELRGELSSTTATLTGAARAARVVPTMLGGSGKRRYLMIFQNNAEARGTGGLPGLYAVVTVDEGRIAVEKLGSNTDLKSEGKLPVDLGADYRTLWGDTKPLWANTNVDPDFPNAARLWLALWKKQTGESLDGAIATDPVAVSYLMRATGPVRLPDGRAVSARNVVGLTMRDVYAEREPGEDQNAFLRSVARATVSSLLTTAGDPRATLDQLGRAVGERRLMIYSAHAPEQAELAATPLAGALPDAAGPYAYLVVNNSSGGKMDFYLARSIRYEGGACSGGQRTSRLTISLRNAVEPDAELPDYVTQWLGTDAAGEPRPRGSIVLRASVFAARGAVFTGVTINGKAASATSAQDDGRPVWSFPVEIRPGKRHTVVFDIVEPASGTAPVIPVQPLVRGQSVETSMAPCS
jgi:protein-tyrosine-phosphatase